MATFTAIKNKTQSRGAMKNSLDYIKQKGKTLWHDRRLVTGHNCVAQSAYHEMMTTKQQFHKTGDRMFYHFVQSFSPEENVHPEEVHAIGLKLARRLFPDFEVIVATHVDTDHLHSHLIVNSVSYIDGHKLHQNAVDLQHQRQISDEICKAHGLTVLESPTKRTQKKTMRPGEYRSAAKGRSWKFQLINTIDLCMKTARTKKKFVEEMEKRGYKVRWEEKRKAITYTTPTGMRCRDDRLHDDKYKKEVMEREFHIREEIIRRRIEAEELAGRVDTAPDALSHTGAMERPTGVAGESVPGYGPTAQPHSGARQGDEGYLLHTELDDSTDGKAGEVNGGDNLSTPTGWEEERAAAFAQDTPAQAITHVAMDHPDYGRVVRSVAALGHAVERSQDAPPVRDATVVQGHSDRKALSKERQKKIAMGHRPDDQENQQQTM